MRLSGEEFDRELKAQFEGMERAAEEASAKAGTRAGGSFGKSFAAAAGVAGAAIGLAINQAANLGAEIASTARQFNISAESLQVWRQAAANAGVSANDFTGSLGTLTQKIGEANAGNRAAQQGFVALGIGFQTTAGEARATDAVMLDLAKRISDIKDPAERARLGAQLLGDEFKTLHPLLLDGAEGFQRARAELGEFGAVLSNEEIRNLEKTNAKIEQMKTVLSIRVASIVADNADAIIVFTDKLVRFATASIDAANAYLGLQSAFDRRVAALPDDMTILEKQAAVQRIAEDEAKRSAQRRGGIPGLFEWKDPTASAPNTGQDYYTDWNRKLVRDWLLPPPEKVVSPSVTGSSGRRVGGGSRGARPVKSEEEKAFEKALDNERKLTEQVDRTMRALEDSARVAQTRADLGDVAAAKVEAELRLTGQIPALQAQTVEELGKALGYTEKMIEARREELDLKLKANKATVDAVVAAAGETAQAQVDAKKARDDAEAIEKAKREADRFRIEYERAIFDVANIYETAFQGGTRDLWRSFKDEGTRIIAEIAAQWTLAMISGQRFDAGSAINGALGRSPLASIFFGGMGGAANDNGRVAVPGFGGGMFSAGALAGAGSGVAGGAGGIGGIAARALGRGGPAQGGASFLQNPGFALGLGTLTTSLIGGGQASQLGGMVGAIGGQALGQGLAALGSFGGPVGAIAGAVIGSLLPRLLSGTPRGSANLTGAGQFTLSGNNKGGAQDTAGTLAGQVSDSLRSIADQLGVQVGRFAVSIGVSGDSFHVDPTGRGRLKKSQGGRDFNQDQAAAIAFAVADAIADGAITGISQASQNLLRRGGDLEKQIEKALMIEQIPRLLRQRFDPLGAAIDELHDKFKLVNDALIEGSASAEQFAQARQLWELEKADAIASIGVASQSLKDFLASLNAGSNSPLSLREQRAEAERQLEPYLAQIAAAETARAEVDRLRASGAGAADIAAAEERARKAAGAINQDGFTQASQLLLSISRQSNASSGAFFSDFDRIRALTGQAIGFVDQASARPGDAPDPFSQAIAQNTQDAAYILSDQFAEMRAQGDTLRQIAAALSSGSGSGFITERRVFAA